MWVAVDPVIVAIGYFAQAGCGVGDPNSIFYHVEFQLYFRF